MLANLKIHISVFWFSQRFLLIFAPENLKNSFGKGSALFNVIYLWYKSLSQRILMNI